MSTPSQKAGNTDSTKKRVRMAPEARKRLILDAALVEFGAHGFSAASTKKIALRAGLSQSGLYTHYKSKESILQDLLAQLLSVEWDIWIRPDQPMNEDSIDQWINASYTLVSDPKVLATFRILIAESEQLPHKVWQWRSQVLKPYLAQLQDNVGTMVTNHYAQNNALTKDIRLLTAPLIQALLLNLIFKENKALIDDDLASLRESHRNLLKELVRTKKTPTK